MLDNQDRNFTDVFEKSRYDITYNICLSLTFFLFVLNITFWILEQPVIYPTSIGLIISIFLIFYLRKTHKYLPAAITISVSGMILCLYTLLFINVGYHFADPLWMIIISLFTFFTLGKKMGLLSIIIQFSGLCYYLFFKLQIHLDQLPPLSKMEITSLAMNVSISALIISYLVTQFLKRNEFAAIEFRKLNLELRQKNELVEKQNLQKTAMLKEIHHRVKNNLQVITSLLRLQSKDLETGAGKEHFNEAIDRISAMALIHNQMYLSENLDKIGLKSYLTSLSQNIMNSYRLSIPVSINFDLQIEHLPAKHIVPVALIFNELISNSLKHAFHGKEKGEIELSAYLKDKNHVHILYRDNGTWKKNIREDSFGLELIDMLTNQLNGEVKRTTDNGTKYCFTFRGVFSRALND